MQPSFLKEILNPSVIRFPIQATDKRSAIEEMLDVLVATGRVSDREVALQDLLEREARMSTGMQNGLAIPHAKTAAVDGMVAAIGLHPTGIPFDSLDGSPAQILVMTLSPLNRTGPHIQFLAEIGRLLSRPKLRERLLAAKRPVEALALLCGTTPGSRRGDKASFETSSS